MLGGPGACDRATDCRASRPCVVRAERCDHRAGRAAVATSRVLLRPLALLIGALLCACIVLPMPPTYITGSVGLDQGVPSFIVPGKTTRSDLWRELGAPYRQAQDGSWLCYGALYDITGYAVIAQGASAGYGPKLEIRRFVVGLDAAGIVERVRYSKIVCHRAGAPSFAYRCVDERGGELPKDFWYETDFCWE